MAVVVGSLLDLQSQRIEEVINQSVDVFLPSLDPIWSNMITTSQGVGSADAIGRDMKIIKVFQGGLTGVIQQAAPKADFVLYGDDTDTLGPRNYLQNVNQTFPDATLGPNQSPYRLAIGMRAIVTNLMMTLGEMTADASSAIVGQILAPKLMGFAQNVAHTMCNYWYLNENDEYQLSGIRNASAVAAVAGSGFVRWTIEPDNFATQRYYQGQRVDVWDVGFTTKQNDTTAMYVESVDELTNTVNLVAATDWGDIATTDLIVYADSIEDDANSPTSGGSNTATGFAGVNSWLKGGTGTGDNILLGSDADGTDQIDVTVHPEHKSFRKNMSGATLTEHTLRGIFRRFHAAKNPYGQTVDCILASDGVWLAYEATQIGRERIDRTGKLSSIRNQGSMTTEDFGGFQFTMDGRTYDGYTSCYIPDGEAYAIRKGGSNWKRYVPPDPSSVQSNGQIKSDLPFRFVMPALTGGSSNQFPLLTSGSAITEATQMPGWLRTQYVPDQPAGIKLTNIATDRTYAD